MMIVTLIFTWHVAAIFLTMVGVGALVRFKVQKSAGLLPMYQMVDTNEPLVRAKDSFDDNHVQHKKKSITNGHISYENSNKSSFQQMLESDSEAEA
jgi:hypothetical protein